jgi:hypothetical protein
MTLFAAMPVIASSGALYAAWQSSRQPSSAAWSTVDVAAIGKAG